MNYGKLEILWGALRRPDLVIRFLKGKQPSEFDFEEVSRFVLTDKPLIVEAGAFDGRDTAIFANKWPNGTIFAFEPLPILTQKVRDATKNLPNVTVLESALGTGDSDTVELFSFDAESDVHGSSSILAPGDHLDVAPEIKFGRKVIVPAITLDAWHSEVGSPEINLLWLDLQGAELMVLKCGEELISKTLICHIEVSRRPLYDGGATYAEVRGFFESRGFRLVAQRIPVRSGNAIFSRV